MQNIVRKNNVKITERALFQRQLQTAKLNTEEKPDRDLSRSSDSGKGQCLAGTRPTESRAAAALAWHSDGHGWALPAPPRPVWIQLGPRLLPTSLRTANLERANLASPNRTRCRGQSRPNRLGE